MFLDNTVNQEVADAGGKVKEDGGYGQDGDGFALVTKRDFGLVAAAPAQAKEEEGLGVASHGQSNGPTQQKAK